MNIKWKSTGSYAKKKYSQIKDSECYVNVKSPQNRADWAVGMLLANQYAAVNGYYFNEVIKAMRTLRELGVEYSVKVIENPHNQIVNNSNVRESYYEFTTPLFEDDRDLPKK
jgi:hypothetical protein